MMMFIPLICLISVALAEPPVGDGYPSSRSSHDDHQDHHGSDHHGSDHHSSDHARSIAQEYPDVSARSGTGYDYSPNTRNAFGRNFPPATVRVSFNQRFSSAKSRSSSDAEGYPNARSSPSEQYGPPSSRALSQEYGLPTVASARSLSTEYGAPNARTAPSEEYGVPSGPALPAVVAARSGINSASNFRSQDSKHAFGARSQPDHSDHSFSGASSRSNAFGFESPKPFSKGFGARTSQPSFSTPSSRSSSTSYAPSSRSSDTDEYSQRPSETYGAPNARSLSQEYGTPSSRSLNNDASAFGARSSPSSTYLPASSRTAPEQQYGTPEQRNGAGGYDYSGRARALEELLSQEPANYDFAYQIEDPESGGDFGHAESRQADRAEGSYFVVLPDGSKQTVEYEADEDGFKPRISVEPAESRSGGYDQNAQDIARSADGPY